MSSDTTTALDSFFGGGSPLVRELEGFAARPEQLEMATLVLDAMNTGHHLAVEAGAGTGKTLAYLVPALVSGQRVIIATATKTLQDQLYHRDLPIVSRAIGRPVRIAQLKGRGNYLCRYRFERVRDNPDGLGREDRRDLQLVSEWAARTHSGDIGEVAGVADGSRIWGQVTSTADNCLGSQCPMLEKCHVVAARKAAAEADLAVVNHHLLVADMTLREDGFGSLLPGADVVIVDEAHRFPDVVQGLFDISFSSRQLEQCASDIRVEATQGGVLDQTLSSLLAGVLDGMTRVTSQFTASEKTVPIAQADDGLTGSLAALAEDLDRLRGGLSEISDVSAGLGRCSQRVSAFAAAGARLADWREQSDLCWVQGSSRNFSAHMTPLDAATQTRELLAGQTCTWILTSATLGVGDDFSHFLQRMAVDPVRTHRIASPYDFHNCARLYLPEGLPDPAALNYPDAVVAAVQPVLAASGGRAFLLFTSRRALNRAAELLAGTGSGYTVLVQGSAPRSRLLDEFTRAERAVLLGTATFWEGVDIRGSGLVVVAIDRLPFASPGDPYLQARLELIRRGGGDPFRDYQLPQAVLGLRQGVGRLIRGHSDYGVVVICDPRLQQRGYGKVFLESLPPMPVTHSLTEIQEFLASREPVLA